MRTGVSILFRFIIPFSSCFGGRRRPPFETPLLSGKLSYKTNTDFDSSRAMAQGSGRERRPSRSVPYPQPIIDPVSFVPDFGKLGTRNTRLSQRRSCKHTSPLAATTTVLSSGRSRLCCSYSGRSPTTCTPCKCRNVSNRAQDWTALAVHIFYSIWIMHLDGLTKGS